jgi:hypothetical protein
LLSGSITPRSFLLKSKFHARKLIRHEWALIFGMGLEITVLKATTSGEINAAFATLEAERPGAIFVAPDPFFVARRVQLALLATLPRIPRDLCGPPIRGSWRADELWN